jgi:hypothetical protein
MKKINLIEVCNFSKWLLRSAVKDVGFYGFLIVITGVVAAAFGCPMPIPKYIIATGAGIVLLDLLRSMIQVGYGFYCLDRDRVFDLVKKKD